MMLLVSCYVLISQGPDMMYCNVSLVVFMDLYFVINNILYISGMMMIHFLTWQTKVFLSYFPTFLFSSS